MQLNFIKNLQLDIKNWQKAIMTQSYNVDWKKYIPSDVSIECVKNNECFINYLQNKYYNSGEIDLYVEKLKNKVNALEIQSDLEFLMNRKFADNTRINIFITTFNRLPYDIEGNFFYLYYYSINDGLKKLTVNIYHELMHFLFHWNYWQKCQSAGLKENQIHEIKEALTVLLNPILEKRNLPLDKGYKIHTDLREKIMKFWQQKNDFEFVLEKIIENFIT